VDVDGAWFDQWYSDMAESALRDAVVSRTLGLPAELRSSSLLSWDGLAEVVELLALRPGGTLVDLACGRGGYGMEVARRTGARVLGVDFSPVAIEQARARTAVFDLNGRAEYSVGDLARTGLPDATTDAVMCVDAIHFAESGVAVGREIQRILRPGGRVVLTCWEAIDASDETLPERLRRIDLAGTLTAAGFVEIEVVERPEWDLSGRALWEAAIALDCAGDPALQSLQDEAKRTLPAFDRARRVRAVASAR
jgi:SAM-dependent methyltransferase